jgi:hydroxymethylbilane synthase
MRIGTRRSALALAQAALVARMIGAPQESEIVPLSTDGDRDPGAGDKSRWTSTLEQALLDGSIDLAVHSAKDVPGRLAAGTALLGSPPRAPAEDVLCGVGALEELAPGARVGTSSLRRLAQLRAAREDLDVLTLRGNVDTRLAKLAVHERGLDAIVLARAGLARLGREQELGGVLDPARFVPAPGQGALALQGRADDDRARATAAAISDADAVVCLRAERALAGELQADCDTPLGAHAETLDGSGLRLRAWVGLPDGSAWASDELLGERDQPEALAAAVAERLRKLGVEELLRGAREMTADGR